MNETLLKYLPENAVKPCLELIKVNSVNLKIVNQRVTRHGDYRIMPNGSHQITVNATPNKYRFLITLIHEIGHLVAFEKFGRRIKPHGMEWKQTFQRLMLPFIRPEIFPSSLLPILAKHFRNPKASSTTDNGKLFKKGQRKVKRYECIEISSGRIYLFQPHAEVEVVTNK
jgi:hypothetical protein